MLTIHSSSKTPATPVANTREAAVPAAIWPWAHSMIAGSGVAIPPASSRASGIEESAEFTLPRDRAGVHAAVL